MVIKKLFPIINLLLIALAVYLGIKGVYAFFSYHLDTLPPPATVDRTPESTEDVSAPPFSDYRVIAERNLFNTSANGEKPKTDILVDSLEQTQLKLKLWGTVPGDEKNAYAVIEDEKDRRQKLYKIGDSIQNATVKMILWDKVVLSLLGKDEILEMENINEKSVSTTSAISQRARASITPPVTRARRRISLNRAQVDGAMNNLNELMGQINIQPHSENGQSDGMILNNIKPNSIFRRMGLRNGDILTAVDGRPITTVDQALKLYEDLKSSDATNIEIKRKGRPTTIEYNIR
jgi:general secretion pathway protein C